MNFGTTSSHNADSSFQDEVAKEMWFDKDDEVW
jgi:hypothetical protein